jgi:hypothetical protein
MWLFNSNHHNTNLGRIESTYLDLNGTNRLPQSHGWHH